MTNMVDTHIRLRPETAQAIEQIAKENRVSFASVVRFACDYNLEKYLASVKYLDSEQGAEILNTLNEISNELQRTNSELNRIGNNYNQQVRLQQIEQKYRDMYHGKIPVHVMPQMIQEQNEAKAENVAYKQEEVKQLLDDFTAVADRLGAILWRIQE